MKSAQSSRRNFLRNASLATVATAGIVKFADLAIAEPTSADSVEKIDLGLRPSVMSSGAVILRKSQLTFVTFNATKHDENGVFQGAGMAVIALHGCMSCKFRGGGGEEIVDHPIVLDSLDFCETYEVLNSSWSTNWQAAFGNVEPNLRHFIFTFMGANPLSSGAVNFECLAQDLSVDFLETESFDEIVAYAEHVDSEYGGISEEEMYADPEPVVEEEMEYEATDIEPEQEVIVEEEMVYDEGYDQTYEQDYDETYDQGYQ